MSNKRTALTKKRKEAIISYVAERRLGGSIEHLVNMTLKAERMEAAELYSWLAKRGYSWFSVNGMWGKANTKI